MRFAQEILAPFLYASGKAERSQQTGWTIALNTGDVVCIVLLNFHERSEFTSILTSSFTSETLIFNFSFFIFFITPSPRGGLG